MDCNKLTQGLTAALCDEAATAGIEADVYLINFNDIDRQKSVVKDNVITSIVLKSSAKAYTFTSFSRSFDEAGSTFNKGTYRNTWTHSLPVRIFTKNEKSKAFVNQLAAGTRIVALVKNKEYGEKGDVLYEAYGWDNGLEVSEGTSSVAMQDGVVYNLTAASSDTAQEGSLPKSVFADDVEATETMIKGLVS